MYEKKQIFTEKLVIRKWKFNNIEEIFSKNVNHSYTKQAKTHSNKRIA